VLLLLRKAFRPLPERVGGRRGGMDGSFRGSEGMDFARTLQFAVAAGTALLVADDGRDAALE